MQLPSVFDASAKEAGSSTARPTVPSKKPVRQQPPGLKMRFRPIGFGNGKTGTIGSSSSSADRSSTESTSDEEMEDAPAQFRQPASLEHEESTTSSDDSKDEPSDAKMVNAPPSPSTSTVKSKAERSAAKESSKLADHPLKRKHSEGGDMKAKPSSSSSTSAYNKQLNSVKKKQKSSPAGSQSMSTEVHKTTSSQLLQVARLLSTPIPLPQQRQNHPPASSQSLPSPANRAPILPPKSTQRHHLEILTPQSLIQILRRPQKPVERVAVEKHLHAVDLDPTAKEWREEVKRLKKDRLLSKSEIEESAISPNDPESSSS